MSSARFWHFWAGVVFLVLYLLGKQRQIEGRILLHPLGLALLIPATYLGTVLPDWDIKLLGIGAHRNPIFHSAIPYFLGTLLWQMANGKALIRSPLAVRLVVGAQVGFVLGLCSHLVLDILQYGDIRWITGETFGKLWLSAHSVVLGVVAWYPHYARHNVFSFRSTQ